MGRGPVLRHLRLRHRPHLIPQLREAPTRQAFWEQARYFWIRRAFRLLPSAWLWLALILACCLLLNRSGAFGSLSANLAASLAGFLQVANFRFADSFYRYEYGASFVYWSLSWRNSSTSCCRC